MNKLKLSIFCILLFAASLAQAQAPLPYLAGSSGTLTTITAATGIPAAALTYSAYGQILQAKAIFFSVETASVNFSFGDQNPTLTAGTNIGHTAASGSWFFFDFPNAPLQIKFINSAAANGAIVKYTIFF